jgi:hypothetical protein
MTLNIDLTPQEEAWLNAQAVRQGLPPTEIVRRLLGERLPEPSAPGGAAVDARSAAAIAYLDRKLKEDATDDPEEIRRAEEELEELKRNLNANRAATGM